MAEVSRLTSYSHPILHHVGRKFSICPLFYETLLPTLRLFQRSKTGGGRLSFVSLTNSYIPVINVHVRGCMITQQKIVISPSLLISTKIIGLGFLNINPLSKCKTTVQRISILQALSYLFFNLKGQANIIRHN